MKPNDLECDCKSHSFCTCFRKSPLLKLAGAGEGGKRAGGKSGTSNQRRERTNVLSSLCPLSKKRGEMEDRLCKRLESRTHPFPSLAKGAGQIYGEHCKNISTLCTIGKALLFKSECFCTRFSPRSFFTPIRQQSRSLRAARPTDRDLHRIFLFSGGDGGCVRESGRSGACKMNGLGKGPSVGAPWGKRDHHLFPRSGVGKAYFFAIFLHSTVHVKVRGGFVFIYCKEQQSNRSRQLV